MQHHKAFRFKPVGFCLAFLAFSILFQNCGQVGSLQVTPGNSANTSNGLNDGSSTPETPSTPPVDQPPSSPAPPTVSDPLLKDPHYKPCADLTPRCTEITNSEDFNYWAQKGISYEYLTYRVKNDIDFGGKELIPFVLMNSVFDGRNFQIKNYVIRFATKKTDYTASIGTFSLAYRSIIHSVKISNFKIYVTQSDETTPQPFHTASLVADLNDSIVINSSASNGLIETVPNVWFIGGLVARGCSSEVHASFSQVHIHILSTTRNAANEGIASGLVGGFPCGNNVNSVTNSYSLTTIQKDDGPTQALKLAGIKGGGFSGLYIDKVYDNLTLLNPDQSTWNFTSIWNSTAVGTDVLPKLKEVPLSLYKKLKFSTVPDPILFDSCEKVSVFLADLAGNSLTSPAGLNLKMIAYGLIPYADANDCSKKVNPLSSITYPAGASSVSFYVKTNLDVAPDWAAAGVQLLLTNDFTIRSVLNVHVKVGH